MKKTALIITIAALLVVTLTVMYAQDQDVKKEKKTEQTVTVKKTEACAGCAMAKTCGAAATAEAKKAETTEKKCAMEKCADCAKKAECKTAVTTAETKSCCASKKESK